MGREMAVVCHWQDRSSAGKTLLESDHLLFRGDFRLMLRFADLTTLPVAAGRGSGLADTKVCAISTVSTALRFVRRRAG